MKLHYLLEKTNISNKNNLPDVEIEGISSRSGEIKKNFIFVCLKGTKNDGHRHIDEALNRGACAVVIEDPKYRCDRSIEVKSTRSALSNMLDVFNGEPSKKLKFVGITGTNGKTSVSVMINSILKEYGIPCELIGTLNCSSFSDTVNGLQANFTTPDPEELYPMLRRMSDGGIELAVMEASSHALKLKKLDPIEFEVGIFTNLTEDHLDFHHTMEDYFKAKLELFNKCRVGIINIDDEYGKKIAGLAKCKIRSCSMKSDADFSLEDVKELSESKTRYSLTHGANKTDLEINIPGEFSIMNSMQAYACVLELSIDDNTVKKSFTSFAGVRGRLERADVFKGKGISVFIDYAHTPDALSKLLKAAKSFKNENGRIILVFGCGGNRERQKRSKMGEIAVKGASFVIITNDNPRNEDPQVIIEDILSGTRGYTNYTVISDRKKAIEKAIALARKDDIVLLAGKGHENYEINSQGKIPFDEREVLRDIEKLQGGMNYED